MLFRLWHSTHKQQFEMPRVVEAEEKSSKKILNIKTRCSRRSPFEISMKARRSLEEAGTGRRHLVPRDDVLLAS